MKTTRQRELSAACGVFVAALGVLVMTGWVFGIEGFKTFRENPHAPEMKPVTAMAFVLLGISIFAVTSRFVASAAIGTIGTLVMLLCTFVIALTESPKTPAVQLLVPSLGTTAALSLSAFGLIAWVVGNGPIRPIRKGCSVLCAIIGLGGVAGHMLGIPSLYWSIPTASAAMAVNTAVGLIVLGLGVYAVEMRR